jgi:hypothetical protein
MGLFRGQRQRSLGSRRTKHGTPEREKDKQQGKRKNQPGPLRGRSGGKRKPHMGLFRGRRTNQKGLRREGEKRHGTLGTEKGPRGFLCKGENHMGFLRGIGIKKAQGSLKGGGKTIWDS